MPSEAPREPGAVYRFEEFTEEGYRRLLRKALKRFAFVQFGHEGTEAHALWRHDVDVSMHRAARLAGIESEEGARATYFFLLSSEFYNLFEPEIAARAKAIVRLGHTVGLHVEVDPPLSLGGLEALVVRLKRDKAILEDLIEAPVTAFSFHDAMPEFLAQNDDEEMAGMRNAYGASVRKKYTYCSDSNGYWRFRKLDEILDDPTVTYLHALTHPEWWTPETISPAARIRRAIEGRARATTEKYERALRAAGRLNIENDL